MKLPFILQGSINKIWKIAILVILAYIIGCQEVTYLSNLEKNGITNIAKNFSNNTYLQNEEDRYYKFYNCSFKEISPEETIINTSSKAIFKYLKDLEKKEVDVLNKENIDSLLKEFSEHPIIPPLFEDSYSNFIIKNFYMEKILENSDKNKNLYLFLDKKFKEIINVINKFNPNIDRNRYNIYILDDNGINAYNVGNFNILVNKYLVQKAYNEHKKNQDGKYTKLLIFALSHEIVHSIKRHNIIKIQYLIVRNFENASDFNNFLEISKRFSNHHYNKIDSKDEMLHVLNEYKNLFKTNVSKNDEKLFSITENIEKEADACSAKIILEYNQKDIHKAEEFIDEAFSIFPEYKKITPNRSISSGRNKILKDTDEFVELYKNIYPFIENFFKLESNLHLNSPERKKFIIEIINKSM